MKPLFHHSESEKADAPPPKFSEKELESTSFPQPSLPFQTSFALIHINLGDRVRLLGFPNTDLPELESIIGATWPRGIQDSRLYGGAHETKLKGNPWNISLTAKQTVESRRFVTGLLRGFFERGWVIKAETSVNKNTTDLTTLIFRHQSPAPPPGAWLSIHFFTSDKLLLIDTPPDLTAALVQTLGGAVSRQEDVDSGAVELKMHGYPWMSMSTSAVGMQIVLLNLIQTLESHGWSLYTTAMLGMGDGGTGSDSWFCVRDLAWVEGAPVYH